MVRSPTKALPVSGNEATEIRRTNFETNSNSQNFNIQTSYSRIGMMPQRGILGIGPF
jgi:hypothetical protein